MGLIVRREVCCGGGLVLRYSVLPLKTYYICIGAHLHSCSLCWYVAAVVLPGHFFFFFFCRIIPFCRPSPSLYSNILSEGLSSAIIFSVQSWTSTLPLFTISFLFLSPLSTLCLCLSLVSVECKPQRFSAKIICCPHA